MALNTRELYLVLKARDEASRAVRAFGSNLGKMGALQRHYETTRLRNQAKVVAQQKALNDAMMARSSATTRAAKNAANSRVLAEQQALRAIRQTSAEEMLAAKQAIRAQQMREAVSQRRMAVGTSMMTGGVAAAAIGGVGIYALNKATDAATEYNKQVALTKTQTDKVRVSQEQLGAMGRKVGTSLAVDFEKIQPTLYDIFSSIDTNAPQAASLLRTIGKAAVAGDTDMQEAGKGIIGILNAYKMSASDATHVSDVMFQLVRKGVGTYKQFTETIGRSVPSAVKAGQSVEDLAGMLAFLTRNGLSAAMASASAGRALDSIANPKSIVNFRNLGMVATDAVKAVSGDGAVRLLEKQGVNFKKLSLNVLDAHGKMRPMVDIVRELNTALAPFTKEQKAGIMQGVFKGSGGTIQAMRFWNHALNDSNNLLGEMTSAMHHANGAAEQAYKTMANTPAAKIQLFKNRFKDLSIEIGNDLIPVKLKLVNVIAKVVGWFDHLSSSTKKAIAYGLAFASAGLIIFGMVAILSGGVVALAGAVEILGDHLALAAGATAGFIAVAAGIMLAIKYHKQIAAVAKEVWGKVKTAIEPAIVAIEDFVNNVKADFQNFGGVLKASSTIAQNVFKDLARVALGSLHILATTFAMVLRTVQPFIDGLVQLLKLGADGFNNLPGPIQHVTSLLLILGLVLARGAIASAFTTMTTAMGLSAISLQTRITGAVTAIIAQVRAIPAAMAAANGVGAKMGALGSGMMGVARASAPMVLGLAAVGGLIYKGMSAWDSYKRKQQEVKQRIDALTQAIIQDNGALGSNTSAAIVNQAQSDGLFKAADRLKVSVAGVTQSLLGNTDAFMSTASAILNASGQYGQFAKAGHDLSTFTGMKDSLAQLSRILGDNQGHLSGNESALKKLSDALVNSDGDLNKAQQAAQDYITSMSSAGVETGRTADAVDNLQTALDNLNGSLGVSQALDQYKSSVLALKGQLDKNNHSIVGNSKAAINNRIALHGVVQNLLSYGAALKQQHKPAAEISSDLQKQAQYMINHAKQMGLDKRQLIAYLTAAKLMPKQIPSQLKVTGQQQVAQSLREAKAKLRDLLKQPHTVKIDGEVSALEAKIKSLQNVIDSLHGTSVQVGVNISASGKGLRSYTAGISIALAEGGLVSGPGGPTADMINAWLSNGEYVINAKKAKRYRRLLDAINFGKGIPAFATGGSVGRKKAAPKPTSAMLNSLHDYVHDPSQDYDHIFKSIRTILQHMTKAMASSIGKETRKLEKLAKRRDTINKNLNKWEGILSNRQQAKASFIDSAKSAIAGSFNATNAPANASDQSLLAHNTRNNVVAFYRTLKSLARRKLNPTTLEQLATQGPDALPQAQALLSMGAGAFGQYNRDVSDINKYAAKTANELGSTMFDAGIQTAQGLVNGLKRQQKQITSAMDNIADALVKSIKSKLKIKSPSKVFHWIGQMMMHGLGNGLNSGMNYVSNVMDSNTNTLLNGWSTTDLQNGRSSSPPVGSYPSQGPVERKIIFEAGSVVTQEINPVKHAADLGWELSRRID